MRVNNNSIFLRKGVEVHVVKNDQVLKDDLHSKVFAMAFSIAAEIERELISQRTKEALARRKAKGKPLRRPNYQRFPVSYPVPVVSLFTAEDSVFLFHHQNLLPPLFSLS
jgi:DNA invertase Pin-like site-specific DNA recombinase